MPCDVLWVIEKHLAATRIQSAVRRMMVRSRTKWMRDLRSMGAWSDLRAAICGVNPRALPKLAACSAVRDEWRLEPGSWMHMLRSPRARVSLTEIMSECDRGWWR